MTSRTSFPFVAQGTSIGVTTADLSKGLYKRDSPPIGALVRPPMEFLLFDIVTADVLLHESDRTDTRSASLVMDVWKVGEMHEPPWREDRR